jgi:hypothetical protein
MLHVIKCWLAHSVDRERPFRPIVNTESGDHERSLAVA